jgi:lysozyme
MRIEVEHLIASRKAISLITHFEGFRAEAYKDPVGIWSIGFGTTEGVKQGDKITVPEALSRLNDHIQEKVEPPLRRYIIWPLLQCEFDALVSFVYNVGAGAFARSTMRRKINEPSMWEASLEFDKWVYAGGKKLNGLITRRDHEKAMFRGNA